MLELPVTIGCIEIRANSSRVKSLKLLPLLVRSKFAIKNNRDRITRENLLLLVESKNPKELVSLKGLE